MPIRIVKGMYPATTKYFLMIFSGIFFVENLHQEALAINLTIFMRNDKKKFS
jgi:hypothetical protein